MNPIRFIVFALLLGLFAGLTVSHGDCRTYYVSSSQGSDAFDGSSAETPFETIARVNSLELEPGDAVRFRCGDIWRSEVLSISRSGTQDLPLVYASDPPGCADPPIFSGSYPITGWSLYSGKIYRADLNGVENAGKFGHGVNQLFQFGRWLPMGRWPNIAENDDGGYATVDAYPAGNRILDDDLPAGDWTGAAIHIKGMRWYILNREVVSSTATTLTAGTNFQCWGGDCTGWGYFINDHLLTLDQDGEWYYDKDSGVVYLYSESGPPPDHQVEGCV